jgi:hypothetical protein
LVTRSDFGALAVFDSLAPTFGLDFFAAVFDFAPVTLAAVFLVVFSCVGCPAGAGSVMFPYVFISFLLVAVDPHLHIHHSGSGKEAKDLTAIRGDRFGQTRE